jgi:hypothetical protein
MVNRFCFCAMLVVVVYVLKANLRVIQFMHGIKSYLSGYISVPKKFNCVI